MRLGLGFALSGGLGLFLCGRRSLGRRGGTCGLRGTGLALSLSLSRFDLVFDPGPRVLRGLLCRRLRGGVHRGLGLWLRGDLLCGRGLGWRLGGGRWPGGLGGLGRRHGFRTGLGLLSGGGGLGGI
ncbi:hypothetical protein [Dinoroseobacter sp. S76]|uniref:hypothetical protein n=1 Tax=Dinoroseobacter sp. S76 TaxID=3415124 RepID=UPI003C7D4C83